MVNKKTFRFVSVGTVCFLFVALTLRGASSDTTFQAVVHLHQGWDDSREQTFYHAPQGTAIMPASWLAALQAKDGGPVMAPNRLHTLGFIADRKSPVNPYGWPIGFAINPSQYPGGATVGLTCAACHTGEITYRGNTLRVDGGQAHIDLDAFKTVINDAILTTGASATEREAFLKRAVQFGYPADRIGADFEARYRSATAGAAEGQRAATQATLAGPGRNDALAFIAQVLFNYSLRIPSNKNRATAPVDYPYLWNIGNLYWVQYNASARQPMSRNIGEALGVGANTSFVDPKTTALLPEPERWRTSIPVHNLHSIEELLGTLQPPSWPEAELGSIDHARARSGAALFSQNCAACHGIRAMAGSKSQEWSVKVLPLETIGTDPTDAMNFKNTTYDASSLGLSTHTDAATGLRVVTDGIRTQAYEDAKIPKAKWPTYDGFGRPNTITAPCGYKARPLVGVWATAPFLHNGSVPTIFDLLSDSRPAHFPVGDTEYDPKQLGLSAVPSPGSSTFDITAVGNSNAGHWFTDDPTRKGRIGPALTVEERYDLIAYLKEASYADYPKTVVASADPEPCVDY